MLRLIIVLKLVPVLSTESNCKDNYEMQELQRHTLRCAEVAIGTPAEKYQECKAQLGRQLLKTCPFTSFEVR